MKDLLIALGFICLAIIIAGIIYFNPDSLKEKQGEIYKEQINIYSQTP